LKRGYRFQPSGISIAIYSQDTRSNDSATLKLRYKGYPLIEARSGERDSNLSQFAMLKRLDLPRFEKPYLWMKVQSFRENWAKREDSRLPARRRSAEL
jgi:hypothetical protein